MQRTRLRRASDLGRGSLDNQPACAAGEVAAAIALSLVVRTVRPGAMEVNGRACSSRTADQSNGARDRLLRLCWVGFFVAAIFAEDRVVGRRCRAGVLLLALPFIWILRRSRRARCVGIRTHPLEATR